MINALNLMLSSLASVLRFGAGAGAQAADIREPIILYEFEGCPFCRIAREAVSETGTPALVRPCPKGGARFRPSVKEEGGKAQFPYMIDPNNDVRLYESADIAKYLHRTYGGKSRPLIHLLGPLNLVTSQFAVLARFMSGTFVRKSSPPAQPLEFYAAERNPGARLAKELLCVMEIEYLWFSRTKEELAEPVLFDPNTGETETGSAKICDYLRRRYCP